MKFLLKHYVVAFGSVVLAFVSFYFAKKNNLILFMATIFAIGLWNFLDGINRKD
jgi:hypothetical protein